jgi:hypothetical protein
MDFMTFGDGMDVNKVYGLDVIVLDELRNE